MQDAKQHASGCSSGQGSQLSGLDGFLVVKCPTPLSATQAENFRQAAQELANPMGLQALILADGMDAQVIPAGLDRLIAEMRANTASNNRIAASVEALVQAMAEAEGVDPEDVPATVGLNGRPI